MGKQKHAGSTDGKRIIPELPLASQESSLDYVLIAQKEEDNARWWRRRRVVVVVVEEE